MESKQQTEKKPSAAPIGYLVPGFQSNLLTISFRAAVTLGIGFGCGIAIATIIGLYVFRILIETGIWTTLFPHGLPQG